MQNFKQADLYQTRNAIKHEIRPLIIDRFQWFYLKKFFQSQKKNIFQLFSLIFFITAIEILIPIFINLLFKKFSYRLDINNLYYSFFGLGLVLIIYIFLNYFGIKKQKILILDLVNKVRQDWLKIYLNKNDANLSNHHKGKILVKISYHFSILQMGLNNSFFVFFQWALFSLGLLIATTFINTQLLIISLLCLPINLFIFYIGYIVSSYYVAQDQTLYSKILQYISDSFNNLSFIKVFHKEKKILENLDQMVEVDNYFRIRREIILTLGNKIIFVSITLFSAGIFLFHIYFPFLNFEGPVQALVYTLVLFLQVKLMYLSLRMGLFYFPLKLGLSLSVPNKNPNSLFARKKIASIQELSFYSKKTKINRNGGYVKDVIFQFSKGGRYLFVGDVNSGKSFLANIFSGQISNILGRSWVIKTDGQRLLYNDWHLAEKNVFYINPYFYPEMPIFNLLSEKYDISIYKQYEIFDFIFKQKKFVGKVLNKNSFSFTEIALLQVLMCLVFKPDLLLIDNVWLDLNHPHLNEAFKILSDKLDESIIIEFISQEKNTHEYTKVYKI